MSVIDFSEHQAHFVINSSDGIHVIPESIIRKVANGSKQSSILTEPVLQAILKDWLALRKD